MNARQIEIIQDFSKSDKLSVTWLAKKYAVSQVTIRNDLKKLERDGFLVRTHGGATTASEEKLDHRMTKRFAVKLRIAEAAADLVSPGETIIIESGSTNALLARCLAESKEVNIITNSCYIANYLRDLPMAKVVLLGGEYQSDSDVCVGPLTKLALQAFSVNKMFFGTDGYSEDGGFTSDNLQRAEIVLSMAERAKECILVSDSSKFREDGHRGIVSGLGLEKTSRIISDEGMPQTAQKLFKKHKIALTLVPAN